MLANSGEMIPPCGVPLTLLAAVPASVRTPARTNALSNARILQSLIRFRMRPKRLAWSMRSKHASISPSTTNV